MRYLAKITQVFLILFSINSVWAQTSFHIPSKILEKIKTGHIYKKSTVTSSGKKQSLDYRIYGIHPNKCKHPLKKLSQYERFYEYLELVKLSGYDEKKKLIYLYLDSALLPFPMVLNFKIERIKKPGLYSFSFDKGFLKGLEGKIYVRDEGNRCLFATTSNWTGKSSGIPDTIFEVFSETVGELVMKKLFRISKKI